MKRLIKSVIIVFISVFLAWQTFSYWLYQRPPVLYNFGIDLASLPSRLPSGNRSFLPFGAQVDNHDGTFQRLPHFTYFASLRTPIIAAFSGYVKDIALNPDAPDYYLWLVNPHTPAWILEYDHLQQPTVKKGDQVYVGQVLGYVPPWGDPELDKLGYGMTEFMLIKRSIFSNHQLGYCPTLFIATQVKDQLLSQLHKLFAKSFSIAPGCLYRTLPTH